MPVNIGVLKGENHRKSAKTLLEDVLVVPYAAVLPAAPQPLVGIRLS
jgi:hypothetical protein